MGLISRVSSRTYRHFIFLKMAQGKMKIKAAKPKTKKTGHKNHNQKNRENKKGRMTIAPKKKALQSSAKLQNELKKAINRKNEVNALSQAKSKGSSFHLIHKGVEAEQDK